MLIMPATSRNFQFMADKIAEDFFTRGVSIADGVVKAAEANDLTPEEVRRLVEKSNTAASLRFLKSAPDKKASFELATTEDVLARTHPAAEDEDIEDDEDAEEEKTAAELPYTRERISPPLFKLAKRQVKTAAVKTAGPSTHDMLSLRAHFDKERQYKLAAELTTVSAVKKLAALCKKDGAHFDRLASDAVALYGAGAIVPVKVAADLAGHSLENCRPATVINDRDRDLLLFKEATEAMRGIAAHNVMIKKTAAALRRCFPESTL